MRTQTSGSKNSFSTKSIEVVQSCDHDASLRSAYTCRQEAGGELEDVTTYMHLRSTASLELFGTCPLVSVSPGGSAGS